MNFLEPFSSTYPHYEPQERGYWEELTPDVQVLILNNIPKESLQKYARVCKQWRDFADLHSLKDREFYARKWKHYFSIASKENKVILISTNLLSILSVAYLINKIPKHYLGGFIGSSLGGLTVLNIFLYISYLNKRAWRRAQHLQS